MSSKDNLAARAQRLQQRREPAAEPATPNSDRPTATGRTAAAPRVKPVRVTTDLSPQAHRALTAFTAELAQELGVARVAHSEVIRALLAELETSPELRAAVTSRLAR